MLQGSWHQLSLDSLGSEGTAESWDGTQAYWTAGVDEPLCVPSVTIPVGLAGAHGFEDGEWAKFLCFILHGGDIHNSNFKVGVESVVGPEFFVT